VERNDINRTVMHTVAALGIGSLVLTGCSDEQSSAAADGESPCAALEGETVTLVVPYSAGGGYDTYARMVAPYLEEELGATVVVENQEGAGGLLAINNLTTAEPDGTTIAIMNGQGTVAASLAGAEGASFDVSELTFLGKLAGESPVFVVGANSGYESWEDVLDAKDFQFSSAGPGAEDYINGQFLTRVFDLDAEVVAGFPGSSEEELAVTAGDTDGMTGDPSSRRGAIENGDHVPVLVIGSQRAEFLPDDVPLITDVEATEEQQALIEPQVALMEVGRPLVGPPGMSEELTGCLRDAVDAMVENPDLIAEAEQQERPINYLSGDEVDGLIRQILDSPDEYKDLLATFFGE
jgi:tripartite-type tricarboxylate transporter receptor subunit TctC